LFNSAGSNLLQKLLEVSSPSVVTNLPRLKNLWAKCPEVRPALGTGLKSSTQNGDLKLVPASYFFSYLLPDRTFCPIVFQVLKMRTCFLGPATVAGLLFHTKKAMLKMSNAQELLTIFVRS